MESELIQGSDQWLQSRVKRFTSSEKYRLMTDVTRPMTDAELADPGRTKGKTTVVDLELLSDGAMTYVYEKVAEELTGMPAKAEVNSAATEWGTEWEPEARKMYERALRVNVMQVGNIIFSERFSGSPDGLIGNVGGVEFKCPYIMSNHVENLLISNAIDLKAAHKEWYWQIQDLLYGTNRLWWDWVSFHPYFEGAKKLHKVRIFRNDEDIYNISVKNASASQMVDNILTLINNQ